jgi:O-antigen ligase
LALYAFAFSIPFEWPSRTIPIDIPALGLLVFLLATCVHPIICYARVPRPLWFFLAYLWVFLFAFARGDGEYSTDVTRQTLTLVQLLLLFTAASNLLRSERLARGTLLALTAGCVTLALLQLSGVVSPEASDFGGNLNRVHALDQNSNRAGRIFGAAILAMVGLTYATATPAVRPRVLVVPAIALCAAAIFGGGSRGSLLVLLIGLWLFTLSGRTFGQWIRNTLAIGVAIAVLFAAASQSPLVRARWEKAQGGDLSGREEIFPAAWSMVTERPVAGWGPTVNKYELATRVPQQGYARRDTHNLGLELLTSTGLAGFIPFVAALLLCLYSSWTARRGPRGMLPFALTASLLAGNMAANYLTFRLQWLVLAYAVASASAQRHSSPWRHSTR